MMADDISYILTVQPTNGGFHSHGGTPKWMVYKDNLIEVDDLEVPLFQETTKYCVCVETIHIINVTHYRL